MFHVTEPYPKKWALALRALPWLLAVGSGAALAGAASAANIASLALAAFPICFGVLTALRVHAAKRGEHDAFYWGWLGVALLSVLVGVSGSLAVLSADMRWAVVFGLLALLGLGGSTISVMLYRIVPFLIWLHWQRANKARARLPLLHQIVAERSQRVQLALDAIAIVLMCVAVFVPGLIRFGALLFVISKLFQAALLLRAMHDFRQRLVVLKSLPPRVRASH